MRFCLRDSYEGCAVSFHLVFVLNEGIADGGGEGFLERRVKKLGLFVLVGDETKFDKDAGHGHFVKHPEAGLLHLAVAEVGAFQQVLLHFGSQLDGTLQIGTAIEREDNIRFRRIGVEITVLVLVILFQKHGGILLTGHIEAGLRLMETHHKGFDSVGRLVVAGVAMDGDEEVGMLVVGNL